MSRLQRIKIAYYQLCFLCLGCLAKAEDVEGFLEADC